MARDFIENHRQNIFVLHITQSLQEPGSQLR